MALTKAEYKLHRDLTKIGIRLCLVRVFVGESWLTNFIHHQCGIEEWLQESMYWAVEPNLWKVACISSAIPVEAQDG